MKVFYDNEGSRVNDLHVFEAAQSVPGTNKYACFPVPPLTEQKKVAAMLSAVQEAKENTGL